MKFEITTTARIYSATNADKLSKLGFTFEPFSTAFDGTQFYIRTKHVSEIEVSSLEELLSLEAQYGPLILSGGDSIEIYDDDRE